MSSERFKGKEVTLAEVEAALGKREEHRVFSLVMVNPDGSRQEIITDATLRRVRSIAEGIKKKPRRKLLILRSGKELPGGANALDSLAYEEWLQLKDQEKNDTSN